MHPCCAFIAPTTLSPSIIRPCLSSNLCHRTISNITRRNPLTPILTPRACDSNDDTSDIPISPQPTSSTPTSDLAVSTAVSSSPTLNAALADAASRALANLSPGGPPNLAIIFVSVRYSVSNVGPSGRHSMDLVVPRLRALIPALKAVVGCSTDGVIGAGPTRDVVEVQDGPGVSLTLMRLPRIAVRAFHVMPDDLPSLDARQDAWQALVGRSNVQTVSNPAFMVFSDPSFADRGELHRFLSGIEYAYPGSSVVGAVASTGAAFAKGHMFCTLPRDVLSPEATSLHDSGLVGICFDGDVQLDCLVSAGCRQIGPELEVRKVGADNTILEMELVGRPSSSLSAVGQLKSIVTYATSEEKRLIQDSLHLGLSIDEVGQGEENYVVRRVIGVDVGGGGISVGQRVHVGQRVRFLVKEGETAEMILDKTMQKYKRVELANSLVGYSNPPFGAMVFVDASRGRALFREPMTETRNLSSFASGVPVAGCFSGGQIGPVGNADSGKSGASVVHHAANLIALIRRRSGMTAAEPMDSDNDAAGTDK